MRWSSGLAKGFFGVLRQAFLPHLLSSFPRRREPTSRQPKVKLQSLEISGMDASLRWHDEYLDSRLRGNDEVHIFCIKKVSFSGRFYALKTEKGAMSALAVELETCRVLLVGN